MSKHVISLTIDLDDSNPAALQTELHNIAVSCMSTVIDDYSAFETVRNDGYKGPYLLTVDATVDGKEVF